MTKRILILKGSPREKGNSSVLSKDNIRIDSTCGIVPNGVDLWSGRDSKNKAKRR